MDEFSSDKVRPPIEMETKWNGRTALRDQALHYVHFPTVLVPISAFIAALSADDKRKVPLKATLPLSRKYRTFQDYSTHTSTVCVQI